MAPIELNFVTGNANKLAEVKAILEPADGSASPAAITVTSRKVDLIEIQAATMEEVTLDKCRRAVELVCSFLFFFLFFFFSFSSILLFSLLSVIHR